MLKSDIQKINDSYGAFYRQSKETSEEWKDIVQQRYYKQYIEEIKKRHHIFINDLKCIDDTINKAEKEIRGLI